MGGILAGLFGIPDIGYAGASLWVPVFIVIPGQAGIQMRGVAMVAKSWSALQRLPT